MGIYTIPILLITLPIITVFLIGISVTWTNWKGAPWVPTHEDTVKQMLELAKVTSKDTVYDLGCGDGRLVVAAAKDYNAKAVGIEIDPVRYLWCKIVVSAWRLEDKVQIIHGNIFKQDLSGADVVICYLLPKTNKDLQEKLKAELPPNARIISNTFDFPEFEKIDEIPQEKGSIKLYKI